MKNYITRLLSLLASLLCLVSNAAEVSPQEKDVVYVDGAGGSKIKLTQLRTISKITVTKTATVDGIEAAMNSKETYITFDQSKNSDLLTPFASRELPYVVRIARSDNPWTIIYSDEELIQWKHNALKSIKEQHNAQQQKQQQSK
jgi:hypothetical protein